MNRIDAFTAGSLLRGVDNIVIISHQKPDGDTLGSAFALLFALEALEKTARVECSDGYPPRFDFLYGDYQPKQFEPGYVVTVDVAGPGLLGDLRAEYEDRINLCIDHHGSNSIRAEHILLESGAAATTLLIYDVIRAMEAPIDSRIADCLFTGLSTDTGCFRYDNVDALAHRVAADLIDLGARHGLINKLMFETKSRGRIEVDRMVMDNLEYHFDGRCALVTIPADTTARLGISEDELDGVASFPRKIEGVLCGVTLRERGDAYRVSLRTGNGLDAAAICAHFDGGGHRAAAGCTITGDKAEAKRRLLEVIGRALEAAEN